jgi:AraC-like DNA-binding protein
MKAIPLTRARHAGNFAIALRQKGVPVEGYLEASHLPVDLLETVNGDSVVSALSMLDFAEKAATVTGIRDLGFWAGTVPIAGYGDFGAHVVRSPSLYSAVQTFCTKVRGECSAADYHLTHDTSKAWFCHGPIGGGPPQQQHELYALTIMVQVIRLALGADWTPVRLRLQQTDAAALADNDFLLAANIEFGAKVTSIELPLEKLATPIKTPDDRTANHADTRLRSFPSSLPTDPLVALQKLVATYIGQSKHPSILVASEMMGVSPRTLQRYLGSKATSYSRLVDQVRFNMALPLLNDESVTISEISYQLGYSNIAHFSRAFSRITGMSPRSYRGILKRMRVHHHTR